MTPRLFDTSMAEATSAKHPLTSYRKAKLGAAMAKDGFKIINSDMHLVEPLDLWQKYLPSRYCDEAPVGLVRRPRDIALTFGGVQPRRGRLP